MSGRDSYSSIIGGLMSILCYIALITYSFISISAVINRDSYELEVNQLNFKLTGTNPVAHTSYLVNSQASVRIKPSAQQFLHFLITLQLKWNSHLELLDSNQIVLLQKLKQIFYSLMAYIMKLCMYSIHHTSSTILPQILASFI